jgi:hypothetical protein
MAADDEVIIMSYAQPIFLALALTLLKCTPSSNDDGGAGPTEDVLLCRTICAKFLCPGHLDPAPSLDQDCADHCTDTVQTAAAAGCSELYQEFLECLDSLSCEDYYRWYEMDSDPPCAALEQELSDACPELEVRIAEG